ncbi:hypothetical protein Ssi03_57930 [Sphaerisporangium siamense]|nr:hypothetical protein Ssi03_57930 [Sphaerisporangium siamense]
MTTLTTGVTAATAAGPATAPAYAAVDDPPMDDVASWNMNGQMGGPGSAPGTGRPRTESRWTFVVQPMIRAGRDAVVIQEAGTEPPPRAFETRELRSANGGLVTEFRWDQGSDRGQHVPVNIYFMDSGQQRNGLAIATPQAADEAVQLPLHVADNDNLDPRPMMGVRFGAVWLFNAHAPSLGRNRDNGAEDVLETIRQFMHHRPVHERARMMADLNANPARMPEHFQRHIVRSFQPTHQGGSELDWTWMSDADQRTGHVERFGRDSDHWGLNIRLLPGCGQQPPWGLRAAAEPDCRAPVPGQMYRLFVGGDHSLVLKWTNVETLGGVIPMLFPPTESPREQLVPRFASRQNTYLLSDRLSGAGSLCLMRIPRGTAEVWTGECDPDNPDQQWELTRSQVLTPGPDDQEEMLPSSGTPESPMKLGPPTSSGVWDLKPWPSLSVMGLGSSTTYGEGSSDGNGFRDSAEYRFHGLGRFNQKAIFSAAAEENIGKKAAGKAVAGAADDTPRVDWVGSVRVGTMDDRDIEGWRGFTISQIADKAGCAVPTYRPNLITLIAGGNDVVFNVQMDTAIGRLEALIDQVSKDSPGVTVLVSGIQPLKPKDNPNANARGEAFTAQIPGMVDRLVARGLRVVYTDISALKLSEMRSDGVHPTDAGYDKIAEAFGKAAEEANDHGWIQEPNPPAANVGSSPCGSKDDGAGLPVDGNNKLGEGWDDRGVIQARQFPSSSRFWLTDVNKDRKAEFVVVDKDQNFRFWWNGGPSGDDWIPMVEGQNSYEPRAGAVGNQLRFGDVDGDGFPDCMVVDLQGGVSAYTWKDDNPSGSRMCMDKEKFAGGASVRTEGSAGSKLDIDPATKIRFADVTGGGRDDYLLIEPDGTTTAWYNQGYTVERTRQYLKWDSPQTISGALLLPREIRYADINGDKRADRILITANGGARAWINEGPKGLGGTYRDIGKIADDADVPPQDVQFADMDGDGKADFVRIGWTGVTHAWLNQLPADYFKTFHP